MREGRLRNKEMRKRKRVNGSKGRGGMTRKRREAQRQKAYGKQGSYKVSREGKGSEGDRSASYAGNQSSEGTTLGVSRYAGLLRYPSEETPASRSPNTRKEREVEVKGPKKGRKRVMAKVRKRREQTGKVGDGKRKEKADRVWEEERVRVGTGYRVRWANAGDTDAGMKQEEVGGVLATPRKREFDVGYGDRKTYERKEGMEVELAKNNIGRRIRYDVRVSGPRKGMGARERVRNEVCNRERRRKRSVYTGCGRTRKSRVGKKKLKPTKVTAR